MINPKQVFLGCSFQKRTNAFVFLAQDKAEHYGADLVFGDNIPQAAGIQEQAFKLISSSRVVILDIVPTNVNVAIEYGYAQGCGRKKNLYLLIQQHLFKELRLPSMMQGIQFWKYRNLEGFGDLVETCLSTHYRLTPSTIDPKDPQAEKWLRDQIPNLLDDMGCLPRSKIAEYLNCAASDVTRVAQVLVQEGKLDTKPNGRDAIYCKLAAPALKPIALDQ